MKILELENRLYIKYLNILGIQKQKPGFEYLDEIVKAQIKKIPFENVSKLFYKKRYNLDQLIDFEQYLDGIVNYGFGGTCYSNNFYFNQLLKWLGYEVKLCGADMKNPDVHIVSIVNIDNHEFLIDTGYSPALSEPIPLSFLNEYILNTGIGQFIIKPNINKQVHLELYRNGTLIHGYRVNPKAREIDEFQQVIKDSFKENSTFMNVLLLSRFDSGNFYVIHNMSFIKSNGKKLIRESINSIEHLTTTIIRNFSIPEKIVLESIDKLPMQKNAWN